MIKATTPNKISDFFIPFSSVCSSAGFHFLRPARNPYTLRSSDCEKEFSSPRGSDLRLGLHALWTQLSIAKAYDGPVPLVDLSRAINVRFTPVSSVYVHFPL